MIYTPEQETFIREFISTIPNGQVELIRSAFSAPGEDIITIKLNVPFDELEYSNSYKVEKEGLIIDLITGQQVSVKFDFIKENEKSEEEQKSEPEQETPIIKGEEEPEEIPYEDVIKKFSIDEFSDFELVEPETYEADPFNITPSQDEEQTQNQEKKRKIVSRGLFSKSNDEFGFHFSNISYFCKKLFKKKNNEENEKSTFKDIDTIKNEINQEIPICIEADTKLFNKLDQIFNKYSEKNIQNPKLDEIKEKYSNIFNRFNNAVKNNDLPELKNVKVKLVRLSGELIVFQKELDQNLLGPKLGSKPEESSPSKAEGKPGFKPEESSPSKSEGKLGSKPEESSPSKSEGKLGSKSEESSPSKPEKKEETTEKFELTKKEKERFDTDTTLNEINGLKEKNQIVLNEYKSKISYYKRGIENVYEKCARGKYYFTKQEIIENNYDYEKLAKKYFTEEELRVCKYRINEYNNEIRKLSKDPVYLKTLKEQEELNKKEQARKEELISSFKHERYEKSKEIEKRIEKLLKQKESIIKGVSIEKIEEEIRIKQEEEEKIKKEQEAARIKKEQEDFEMIRRFHSM